MSNHSIILPEYRFIVDGESAMPEAKFNPPSTVEKEAKRGLELRKKMPPSRRGGTGVGIARARDIIANKDLPVATLKRMKAFFDRHEVDKQASGWTPSEEGYPSKGLQAWLLWGGDSGRRWVEAKLAQYHRAKQKK